MFRRRLLPVAVLSLVPSLDLPASAADPVTAGCQFLLNSCPVYKLAKGRQLSDKIKKGMTIDEARQILDAEIPKSGGWIEENLGLMDWWYPDYGLRVTFKTPVVYNYPDRLPEPIVRPPDPIVVESTSFEIPWCWYADRLGWPF